MWPGLYVLRQFSWDHNLTPKVASNMRKIVQLLHDMYNLQIIINVSSYFHR